MSVRKKKIRTDFRNDTFERDDYVCLMCGLDGATGPHVNREFLEELLDAHHIKPREDMPNGGYVKENGISLCKASCHLKAEEYLSGTVLHEGFSPEELYEKIDSTHNKALQASARLGKL